MTKLEKTNIAWGGTVALIIAAVLIWYFFFQPKAKREDAPLGRPVIKPLPPNTIKPKPSGGGTKPGGGGSATGVEIEKDTDINISPDPDGYDTKPHDGGGLSTGGGSSSSADHRIDSGLDTTPDPSPAPPGGGLDLVQDYANPNGQGGIYKDNGSDTNTGLGNSGVEYPLCDADMREKYGASKCGGSVKAGLNTSIKVK